MNIKFMNCMSSDDIKHGINILVLLPPFWSHLIPLGHLCLKG